MLSCVPVETEDVPGTVASIQISHLPANAHPGRRGRLPPHWRGRLRELDPNAASHLQSAFDHERSAISRRWRDFLYGRSPFPMLRSTFSPLRSGFGSVRRTSERRRSSPPLVRPTNFVLRSSRRVLRHTFGPLRRAPGCVRRTSKPRRSGSQPVRSSKIVRRSSPKPLRRLPQVCGSVFHVCGARLEVCRPLPEVCPAHYHTWVK